MVERTNLEDDTLNRKIFAFARYVTSQVTKCGTVDSKAWRRDNPGMEHSALHFACVDTMAPVEVGLSWHGCPRFHARLEAEWSPNGLRWKPPWHCSRQRAVSSKLLPWERQNRSWRDVTTPRKNNTTEYVALKQMSNIGEGRMEQ